MQGSLSTTAELPVAKCNIARYSHAGGLLAAAGGSNTIFVYPTYYGHEGAAGRASGSRAPARSHNAAAAAGSGEGGAVLEAVVVLKGHVSSVTDLVGPGCLFLHAVQYGIITAAQAVIIILHAHLTCPHVNMSITRVVAHKFTLWHCLLVFGHGWTFWQ